MAIKEFNVDLDVKGRVLASTVPNSTGSIVTWNTTTNVFGLRTNSQIISDLNLSSNFITSNTTQTGLTGNKTSNGIWTLGQVRKAGQSDTQMLLAGGGHRPVSDFALKAHTHTFASLTSKPTTIGGYGITDFNSLGDARWALRTRTITGTGGLTGGGNLTANRTIALSTDTQNDIAKGVVAEGWTKDKDNYVGIHKPMLNNNLDDAFKGKTRWIVGTPREDGVNVASNGRGFVLGHQYNSANSYGTQFIFSGTDDFVFRNKYAGDVNPWRKVWHDGNLLQSSIDNWNTAYDWGDFRDWGLGTVLRTSTPNYRTDLNDYTNTGFSRFHNTELNRPFDYGTLYHAKRTDTEATQLAIPIRGKTSDLAWRGIQGDLNHPWRYVWDDFNLPNPATETWTNSQLQNYYTKTEALNQFVGLAGVQNIADTKTFLASPVVPNPTLDAHAVNKKYVDDIEIGGRNLLIGSKTYLSQPWGVGGTTANVTYSLTKGTPIDGSNLDWSDEFLITSDGESARRLSLVKSIGFPSLSENQKVTISFWFENLGQDKPTLWLHNGLVNMELEGSGFYSQTSTVSNLTQIRIYNYDNPSGDLHFKISGLKLEKGTKATDWTPAPEDQVTDWNETNPDSYSFLKNKPTKLTDFTNDAGYITSSSLPTVNNGTLTLSTGTGLSGSATFTANQSGNSTFTVSPIFGTTAGTIAQGNDSRIDNGQTAYNENSSLTLNSIQEWDDLIQFRSQFVRATNPANTPFEGVNQGIYIPYNNLNGAQLVINRLGSIQYRSTISNNTWGAIRTVWDDNNLPQSSIDNWNTSYGWGDHSQEGYATQSWVNSQGFSTQTLSSSTSNIISGSTVQRAALTGDVTADQDSNETTIANKAVTLAKMDDLAANSLIGRGSGTGVPQRLTLGNKLSISGTEINAEDTTYNAGTLALLNAGTNTENRVWGAKPIADFVKQYAAANLGLQGVTEIGNWTDNAIDFVNGGNLSFTITNGINGSTRPDAPPTRGVPALQSTGAGMLLINDGSQEDFSDKLPNKFGMLDNTAVWANSFTFGGDYGFRFGYSTGYQGDWVSIELNTQLHNEERIQNGDYTPAGGGYYGQQLHFPPENNATLATREWSDEQFSKQKHISKWFDDETIPTWTGFYTTVQSMVIPFKMVENNGDGLQIKSNFTITNAIYEEISSKEFTFKGVNFKVGSNESYIPIDLPSLPNDTSLITDGFIEVEVFLRRENNTDAKMYVEYKQHLNGQIYAGAVNGVVDDLFNINSEEMEISYMFRKDGGPPSDLSFSPIVVKNF